MAKKFSELSESEVLALAIALEEEDSRIYGIASAIVALRESIWGLLSDQKKFDALET